MRSLKSYKWVVVALAAALAIGALGGCASLSGESDDQNNARDADWHYEMAAGYFESNEIPLALRELTKALDKDPEHFEAHYLKGFIHMGRRDYSNAIQHFKKSLDIEPEYYFAKNNLGSVYLAMDRWEDAVEIFEELVDEPLYSTPELAHNNIGWAYFNLGEYRDAVEHFKQAVFLKPEMCLAHNNLGRTYEKMSRMRRAEKNYRKAIRKCPGKYAEPHFRLAKLLQKQEDSSARSHFEKCLEIEPESNLGDRCRQYLQVR